MTTAPSPPPPPSAPGSDSRGWAVAAHLSGPVLLLASAGFLAFVAPLAIWLVKRDDDPFVGQHALEALNLQLTAALVAVAAWVLAIPTIILGVLTLGIGFVVAALVAVVVVAVYVVTVIQAAIRAGDGQPYCYPVAIRFVRAPS